MCARTDLWEPWAGNRPGPPGLNLDPTWPRSGGFELDDLFADDQPAKNVYLDALVDAAIEKPNDADLSFMAGVHLFFDGRTEEAGEFFERAKRLAGPDAGHIEAFILCAG